LAGRESGGPDQANIIAKRLFHRPRGGGTPNEKPLAEQLFRNDQPPPGNEASPPNEERRPTARDAFNRAAQQQSHQDKVRRDIRQGRGPSP
jgi:hypothetical protein